MTENTDLLKRREELKRQLADGEYKTLIDTVLDGIGRIIQKITRYPRSISHWITSAVLYLIILLIPTILIRMGDPTVFARPTDTLFPGFFLLRILIGYSSIAIMVAGNIYLHRVFTTFHDSVLDTIESNTTMDVFEHWLKAVCNQKTHLIVSLLVGILIALYIIFSLYTTQLLIPIGTAIGTLFISISFAAFMYLLVYMVVLSARMGGYHLKLYIANPSSSEVISSIAGLLSNFVYLVAMYAAFLTLSAALVGSLTQAGVVVLPLVWGPIVAMFVLNQRSISSIIKRAKWKTLNEIQANVEQLHTSNKLGEKDTMEAINRLMDYYDRILKTHSSAFNTEAIWSLINSLLLPLLALLLGNLDKIIALFH